MKKAFQSFVAVLLMGCMVFGGLDGHVEAKTEEIPRYQVLTHDSNGKQISIGFNTKETFDRYIKTHPVHPKGPVKPYGPIFSTFYEHENGQGWQFSIDASNPPIVTNFMGYHNDNVSSVRTHPQGNYTYLYEHHNAKGYALAIANNGGLYNLNGRMGDGRRTWNDEASSTIVRSR
ncbi:hypothetical protein [Desmospora profundinema]|uniref:Beta/gamma crystallin 'Greek key' domain-containing protein n=1 Tax=Desmospora profundinema TaxID=1571184 RepID=A0ABU1IIC4_9BACL|nr:hypothetical protein [Desmospora profundinema]MDR6224518.1 hypothetical protein [Desmospora profundinema]